jgi:alcohol dehydrogenase class IV
VIGDFTWHDGERLVRFGRGALGDAADLLGEGYVLLTTERAAGSAPDVVARSGTVRFVPKGRVDEVAGDLLEQLGGPAAGAPDERPATTPGEATSELYVGLGGGHVVDVAKALAAARGADAAAIPTTLSAAEMTGGHRHARGVAPSTRRVRPRLVLNDPALSASQPDHDLAASAANALGHAIEGPLTPRAAPVPVLTAHEAARLLALDHERDALALGALLAGCVIDSTGYGLHHVLAQTLARSAGVWHGHANAAMLPHTTAALRRRSPDALAALDRAAGIEMETLARRFAQRAGAQQLRDLGVSEEALETCVRAVLERARDLGGTPPPADESEVRALYEAAW